MFGIMLLKMFAIMFIIGFELKNYMLVVYIRTTKRRDGIN